MLIRMGGTFARLSSFIKGAERDLLPVIVKAGGTVDRVNDQLDKLDTVTDSAVAMADNADTAVRAVSTAITTPVKKVSGLAAGISHGFSAFRARRDAGEAVRVAKDAAARRESELDEELRNAGQAAPPEARRRPRSGPGVRDLARRIPGCARPPSCVRASSRSSRNGATCAARRTRSCRAQATTRRCSSPRECSRRCRSSSDWSRRPRR